MPELEYELLPKQKKFVLAAAPQCLYSGAFGAGKSYAVCVKAVMRASNKYAREALVRKYTSHLRGTTLRTLLSGDGITPPVLPEGSYTHYKADKIIKIHGGGEIVYFSLEDAASIGSYNLTGAGIDQAEELTESDYLFLLGRLRSTGPGITRQLYAACNPDSPSHHLAKRFGLSPDVIEPMEGCWSIVTSSKDNTKHLPGDYLKILDSFTGVRKKRYVDGMWAGSDGVVYDNWSRDMHVRPMVIDPDDIARVIIGVDDGTSVPFACLRAIKTRDGRKHIERVVYGRQMKVEDRVKAIQSMMPFDVCVVDPSASTLKLELQHAGIPVRNAINDVRPGIDEVASQLCVGPSGEPWLTVDPSCVDLIREMETYEWKKTKGVTENELLRDEPVKENDHAVDGLRYICMEDRLPAAGATESSAVRAMGKNMIEDKKPRFVGYIDPVMGWGREAEDAVRAGDQGVFEFTINPDDPTDGLWRVWCGLPEDRPDQSRPWVVAASVGTGAAGSVSCIKVGDAETRRVEAECVLVGASPEDVAREAVAAGCWFGGVEKNARLIWNNVGGGVAFAEKVRMLRYRNVYRHVEQGAATEDPGWQYSPAGIIELLSNLQAEVKAGKYHEATKETIAELQRWQYGNDGSLSPNPDTASGNAKYASDRALAAMLLSHAFRWVARLKPVKPKPEVGSLAWLEKNQKSRPKSRVLRRMRG